MARLDNRRIKRFSIACRCPKCLREFAHFNQKGRGPKTCPSCRFKPTARADFVIPPGEHAENTRKRLLVELAQRKEERTRRLMETQDSQRGRLKRISETGAIKADQVPVSKAEARFKGLIAALGGKPHRPSWPDFLVEIDGKIVAVEVKRHPSDSPTATQRATFELLERVGLPVYIWTPGCRKATRYGRNAEVPADKPKLALVQNLPLATGTKPE